MLCQHPNPPNQLSCLEEVALKIKRVKLDWNAVMIFAPCHSECLGKIVLLMNSVDQVWNADLSSVLYLFFSLENNALLPRNVNLAFYAVMIFAPNHLE